MKEITTTMNDAGKKTKDTKNKIQEKRQGINQARQLIVYNATKE